ncbi:MAG: hypothetical protein ABI406_11520 [Ktedonobacteraceae bacterium]
MHNHHHEQTHNVQHVEVFLPSPAIDNCIEFIDLISPYDDDGYEETLEQQVPLADVIIYASGCNTLPSNEKA